MQSPVAQGPRGQSSSQLGLPVLPFPCRQLSPRIETEFSRLQLVECGLSKQYFCFPPLSPLPANSSHTSSAHGDAEQSGAYESRSSFPAPSSNRISICSQSEGHCPEPEASKHGRARPKQNPFSPSSAERLCRTPVPCAPPVCLWEILLCGFPPSPWWWIVSAKKRTDVLES